MQGQGRCEWAVGGGNVGSASLLFANFERLSYHPWNRTLASFSKASQAVLVISFPTMLFFFSFFLLVTAGVSVFSVLTASCHLVALGILYLPPCFFFSQDVSRDHDPISLRSLRLLILISHTPRSRFEFSFHRNCCPVRHRACHVPASAAPHPNCTSAWSSWAILLYSDTAASPPHMPRVHIM